LSTILKRLAAAAPAWIAAVGGVAAIAFAVAGCGGSSGAQAGSAYGSATGQPTAAASAPAAPAGNRSGAASITLANSNLGKILVNSKGQTLYLFQADKGTASTCNGACASAWPPVITNGAPVAGAGVSSAKLGTTKRGDGTHEVTYNGHPLYTFVGDSSPGQATGEGNPGFGAEWDVVSAAGNKIEIGN
jgi:predicted lipoprotein with Yx(FWY)xxD motif